MAPVSLHTAIVKTEQYPIDLPTLLRLVADQNLSIAESRKNTEVLLSRYRQRQVALLPNIEGTYVQSRLRGAQQTFGGEIITVIRETVQPQLTASWTLYPGGRQIYEALAARRRKLSADSLLRETYQQQLAGAAQEYYQLLAALAQKKVVEQALIDAEEQVRLNEARVDVGRGVPLDLSQARTQYALQQSSLVQAESAWMQTEQALLNRLNLDPMIHLVPLETEATPQRLIPEDFSIKTLIAKALSTHPSLQTAEQELRALGFDLKATRSDLIPSITLRTYVNGTGVDWQSLTKSTFKGLTVNMNLLESLGLAVPFRMQEQRKLLEQRMIALQNLRRNIETEVTLAFLSSENFRTAIAAARQQVASAEESYALAVGRFQAGYGINLDVLTAQTALANARSTLAQAIANYNQAQVRLLLALGDVSPQALVSGLSPPPPQQGNHPHGTGP